MLIVNKFVLGLIIMIIQSLQNYTIKF